MPLNIFVPWFTKKAYSALDRSGNTSTGLDLSRYYPTFFSDSRPDSKRKWLWLLVAVIIALLVWFFLF